MNPKCVVGVGGALVVLSLQLLGWIAATVVGLGTIWVYRFNASSGLVDYSRQLRALLDEDDDAAIEVVDGKLVSKVGVALRLAREVKIKFGGTPSLNEANRLLAARYIQDVMDDHGITRKIDRARIMYRVRAIVFTPLSEEIEEAAMVGGSYSSDQRSLLSRLRGSFAWST